MYRHGIPLEDAPEWINILIVCEEWGCPPWEVTPGYANRRWWLKARNFLTAEKVRAQKDKNG